MKNDDIRRQAVENGCNEEFFDAIDNAELNAEIQEEHAECRKEMEKEMGFYKSRTAADIPKSTLSWLVGRGYVYPVSRKMKDEVIHYTEKGNAYLKDVLRVEEEDTDFYDPDDDIAEIIDIHEFDLLNFDPWCGAEETRQKIIDHGMVEEFNRMVEEIFEDEASGTEINNFLLDDDFIYYSLCMEEEEEENDII